VLTLLTSIHVACAAQVNNDIRTTTTEPIHEIFIYLVSFSLFFWLGSFFLGCDFFAARLFSRR